MKFARLICVMICVVTIVIPVTTVAVRIRFIKFKSEYSSKKISNYFSSCSILGLYLSSFLQFK